MILAVNRGDRADAIKEYVAKGKWTFPILHADGDIEPVDAIAARYGVTGYPTNFVIGKDGKVAARCLGFDEIRLRKALDAALK